MNYAPTWHLLQSTLVQEQSLIFPSQKERQVGRGSMPQFFLNHCSYNNKAIKTKVWFRMEAQHSMQKTLQFMKWSRHLSLLLKRTATNLYNNWNFHQLVPQKNHKQTTPGMLFCIFDCFIDNLVILWLLRGLQDKWWVCGGICGHVFLHSCSKRKIQD